MHAALVEDFAAPPRYRETAAPVAGEGEVLLQVRGAALSNLVRGQASGAHYSSGAGLPFIPGNDGVGVSPGGLDTTLLLRVHRSAPWQSTP